MKTPILALIGFTVYIAVAVLVYVVTESFGLDDLIQVFAVIFAGATCSMLAMILPNKTNATDRKRGIVFSVLIGVIFASVVTGLTSFLPDSNGDFKFEVTRVETSGRYGLGFDEGDAVYGYIVFDDGTGYAVKCLLEKAPQSGWIRGGPDRDDTAIWGPTDEEMKSLPKCEGEPVPLEEIPTPTPKPSGPSA